MRLSYAQKRKMNQDALDAGWGAYRMLIPAAGNGYTKPHYRNLWQKGWWLAYQSDPANRYTRGRKGGVPAPYSRRPLSPGQKITWNSGSPGNPPVLSVGALSPDRDSTWDAGLVGLTFGAVERFNKKHQTRG